MPRADEEYVLPSPLNADTVDNYDTSTTAVASKIPVTDANGMLAPFVSKVLGAWETKSVNTVYQAATDGFVLSYVSLGEGGYLRTLTDSSDSPTTKRADQSTASGTTQFVATQTVPVKKNDYYKIESSGSPTIYWIPLGS